MVAPQSMRGGTGGRGLEGSLPGGASGLDVAEAAKPLLAARASPDVSPAAATFLAPSARSLEQHTNSVAHRRQERCALFEAVCVAENSQPFGLSADRVAEPLTGLVVVQRDEPVGRPCEIPKWRCRRGEIPVDERMRNSAALVDGVVRRQVVVTDHASLSRRSDHELPTRLRGRDEGPARVVERANQSAHTRQLLVGMRRLASMNEGEDLDVSLQTERAWCSLETHVVKVPEQRVHRRRPVPGAPTHGFATPLNGAQPAADAHSRSMALTLWRPRTAPSARPMTEPAGAGPGSLPAASPRPPSRPDTPRRRPRRSPSHACLPRGRRASRREDRPPRTRVPPRPRHARSRPPYPKMTRSRKRSPARSLSAPLDADESRSVSP